MALVVDSSIAASWGLPDENCLAAAQALDAAATEEVIVPGVFWHELRNVFLVNERRRRLTSEETEIGLKLVEAMSPRIDETTSHQDILHAARRHGLTAYDAVYLALALRIGATLATLDIDLAKAATSEKVPVITERS
jgi:predicted nucleic acid-binding protein